MNPEQKLHETITTAALNALADFFGQSINAQECVEEARALYDGKRERISCVVEIPFDKTKPIKASVHSDGSMSDGVACDVNCVKITYYLYGRNSSTFKRCVMNATDHAPKALELLTAERTKRTPPPPPAKVEIPFEFQCRELIKEINAMLGTNLNEAAVLSAGEVARAAHVARSYAQSYYVVSVVKSTRLASFQIVRTAPEITPDVLVICAIRSPVENGLITALQNIVQQIPRALKELNQKPALTAQGIIEPVRKLNQALGTEPYLHFVFGDYRSTTIDKDCEQFLKILTSGAPFIRLTFQPRARRQHLASSPLIYVNLDRNDYREGFDTSVTQRIDPENPADALTALAEYIKTHNL